ncbi:hypothetical protein FEM48_Zijuj09G0029500 [Ziziphus jujuba var. spinosa]|uniref:At1g61320/AtMIF1 LRR domain-containing protein n=1 Tax=Ziziphus jujuba var. spinosa TaxID=714518 RepID=A0A978UQH9_ZIZJJ|nr:hypothetical protein FEM48_Zijuj09G0029500 [Ziziphus jujuba var. spinosa]
MLAHLPQVKILKLTTTTLGVWKMVHVPELSKVEHLEIYVYQEFEVPFGWSWHLLQAVPFLHSLSIKLDKRQYNVKSEDIDFMWILEDIPKEVKVKVHVEGHSHQYLKVVKLIGFGGCRNEIEFLLQLFEGAVSLEKIIIQGNSVHHRSFSLWLFCGGDCTSLSSQDTRVHQLRVLRLYGGRGTSIPPGKGGPSGPGGLFGEDVKVVLKSCHEEKGVIRLGSALSSSTPSSSEATSSWYIVIQEEVLILLLAVLLEEPLYGEGLTLSSCVAMKAAKMKEVDHSLDKTTNHSSSLTGFPPYGCETPPSSLTAFVPMDWPKVEAVMEALNLLIVRIPELSKVEHLEIYLIPEYEVPFCWSCRLLQAVPFLHNLSIKWMREDITEKVKAGVEHSQLHQYRKVVELIG